MFFPVLLASVLALNPAAEEAQASAPLTHAEATQAATDGREAEALAAFQRLAAMNPADHEARLWIARLHARMGHQNLAEPVFRSVMLEDLRNVDARVGVAAALLARDEPSEALDVLAPAAELAPDNAEVVALTGRAHELSGRTRDALTAFERAATMSPSVDRRHTLETARLSYLSRVEIRGATEQFSDTTPDSQSGDIALNIRLSDALRVIARGQVQEKFDESEQRAGGGLEWRWTRATTLRGQALFGVDTLVMPERDVLGEVEHTYAGVTWTGTVRYFGFGGASTTFLAPAVAWMPTDRLELGVRYALSFTDIGTLVSRELGQSLHVQPAYRMARRVWLQGTYAAGVEDFENFSIDRIGDFRAQTVSGGIRIDLPSLTSIVARYERQWRQNDVTLGRATLSLLQRF
jgi:tetratricopeptide (TPR) repeat protein